MKKRDSAKKIKRKKRIVEHRKGENFNEKLIFNRVLFVVVSLFWINLGYYVYKFGFNKGITGFSIAETFSGLFTGISSQGKIILLVQWVFLIFVLFLSGVKDKRVKSRKKELQGINLKKSTSKSGTDLDTLHNVLQKKKQLRVSTISKLFNINKDTAMSWAKTLESGNLATIDYKFGEAIVKSV